MGYIDKVRRFLIEQARHMNWVAAIASAPLVLLMMWRWLPWSVKVRVDVDRDFKVACDSNVPERVESGLYRVRFPKLNGCHTITVEDIGDKGGNSKPFSLSMGRFRILRGALAQIPVAGRLFGLEEVRLSPLYNVRVETLDTGWVKLEGDFQEGFVDPGFLATHNMSNCQPDRPANWRLQAVRCLVYESGALKLPLGKYDLTWSRSKFPKPCPLEVKQSKAAEKIDLDNPCPKN